MKYFLLFILLSSNALSAEYLLGTAHRVDIFDRSRIEERFQVDFDRGEVYGVAEFYLDRNGTGYCPSSTDVTSCWAKIPYQSIRAKIEGLRIVGDEVIFDSSEGSVNCGTVRPGRIFRRARVVYFHKSCRLTLKERASGYDLYFVTK